MSTALPSAAASVEDEQLRHLCDYRTHRHRKSTRLRECPACKQREQGVEGGAAQAEGGEEGIHKLGLGREGL